MSVPRSNKPLEYWIGRCTDPYLEKKDRLKCLEMLSNKINAEPEAATICVDLLAHKVVSPDQDEAIIAVQTIDYLMRNCGDKVHVKVGKFRFLNQLVKLTTPKYLGSQTSVEMKNLVIRLMYTWQKTIPHIPKFKEVYDTLKSNGLITEDPKIPEEEITIVPPIHKMFPAPAPRCAVFEDEEKSRLLKNLLASNNPEDLQMANRLIKSLVQTEESKMAKIHERRRTLDSAIILCKAIDQFRMDKTAQSLGLSSSPIDIDEKLQTACEQLSNMQGTLYGYANELAEANDPCLEEVLNINDHINKLLPKNEKEFSNKTRITKKDKSLLLLENEELLVLNSPNTEKPPNQPSSSDANYLEGSLLNNMVESELLEDVNDVPFIGFDKHMTPVLPRRSGQKAMNVMKPHEKSIFETDYLENQRLPEVPKPLTLNQLVPNPPALTLESLDSLLPSIASNQSSPSPVSIPEEVVLNPANTVLQIKNPLVILDNDGIRVLLYWCNNDNNAEKSILSYVISIQNHSTEKLTDVKLIATTSDKNVAVRLQSSKTDLLPFNLNGTQNTMNLLLCVLPFTNVKQVDIDFSLTFVRLLDGSISGNFILPLR